MKCTKDNLLKMTCEKFLSYEKFLRQDGSYLELKLDKLQEVRIKQYDVIYLIVIIHRHIYNDNHHEFRKELNYYELLMLVEVLDQKTPKELGNVKIWRTGTLKSSKGRRFQKKSLSLTDFLDKENKFITLSDNEKYSVSEFIEAIAYNGILHWKSDSYSLNNLYENFIVKYPQETWEIIKDLYFNLHHIIEYLYKKISGNKDLYFPYDSQPLFSTSKGDLVRLSNQEPALYFSNKFGEIALPISQSQRGIRIETNLELDQYSNKKDKEGYIFTIGNFRLVSIDCSWSTKALQVSLVKKGGKKNQYLAHFIVDTKEIKSNFNLMIIFHGDGTIKSYIDKKEVIPKKQENIKETSRAYEDIKTKTKVCIGGDLSGKNRGSFYLSGFHIQELSKSHTLLNSLVLYK